MGPCASKKTSTPHKAASEYVKYSPLCDETEYRLLKLIFQDLASRSHSEQLSMEDFLLFFHKNGYWGQRLFEEFDARNSNNITEEQFISGIVKIYKTTEEEKVELLFKFFANDSTSRGITYNNFLQMLYNYPKEDLSKILNDQQFVNQQLKGNLIAIESKEPEGRRLISLTPYDLKGKLKRKAFVVKQNLGAERVQSNYASQIIQELDKRDSERKVSVRVNIGGDDVEIKTTSIHQLVKRFARSIFKHYGIDERAGRMSYQNFKDWVIHHKNLYNDYYKGFHNDIWEVEKATNTPIFASVPFQYSSRARVYNQDKLYQVEISLLNSTLIVCSENQPKEPIFLICLEGLAVNPTFDDQKGHGIEITHRDGIYAPKKFWLPSEAIQKEWAGHLRFFKGTSINQLYQINEQIGIGKFSVVYAGVEKENGESVAVKVIESFKLDEEAKESIAHESSIMSIMSHPLLIFFKESIVTKTHIYIITELVKGKDLFDFVRDFDRLSEFEAAYVMEQVILGVGYIHSLGIVHRDLKPENVMVEFDPVTKKIGRIKIIDFGFANHLSKLQNEPRESLLAGTPNYMAPEILNLQSFDHKLDNFALGSILYYILSGGLPFNDASVAAMVQRTISGSYNFEGKGWEGVSAQAKDLIKRLLEIEPSNRISLDDALVHPWFNRTLKNRGPATSLLMTRKSDSATRQHFAVKH